MHSESSTTTGEMLRKKCVARSILFRFLRIEHASIAGALILCLISGHHHANGLSHNSMNTQQPPASSTTTMNIAPTECKRLVLIGGGHTHVQVIRALKLRPSNLEVTVIDLEKAASYSGMIPGCVAGLYTPDQTLLHLEPLCEWAGITFIQDEVLDIDLDQNRILLRNGACPIPYDAISFDIGSTARGLDDIPGALQYSIPTRPIAKLVQRIQDSEMMLGDSARVVVVGGGAAGIELAMSMRARWGKLRGDQLHVTLLDSGNELLPMESESCRTSLNQVLKDRQIEVCHKCHVKEVTTSHIVLEEGDSIPYTHCIWAAGAAAHSLPFKLRRRGLGVDAKGWIQVNANLQSISHQNVFAAGDCCTLEAANQRPSPPKAGVYAVRAGPVLIENLPAFLYDRTMRVYNPQDDFLKLLSCGDGTGLGFRFGVPLKGKWVFEMKDHIDQMFMDLFRRENLPEIMDTESSSDQFDSLVDDVNPPLTPEGAALLIQRSDENVIYMTAWRTIRHMTRDEDYRSAVLNNMRQTQLPQ